MNPHLITLTALAALTLAGVASDAGMPADPQAESIVRGAVTNEELSALANEVNLPAWTQVATSRDFTTIDESWVAVYSPKDAVGEARNWSPQVATARSLAARATKASQKRWLGLFIRAGEAIAKKDAVQFVAAVRALENDGPSGQIAFATILKFFTAK